MRRLKKFIFGMVFLVVVFTIVGFFVIPPVLKSVLTKRLSENFGRDVTIEAIRFNPFTLGLSVKGFVVKEPGHGATFLSFKELFINLEAISVLKKGLIVEEVRLVQPYVGVSRSKDNTYNFSDLLAGDKQEEDKRESPLFPFSIRNIQVIGGKVDFRDDPKETRHTIEEIHIGLPFLSSMADDADAFVMPKIAAKINGASYILEGRSKPFRSSRDTEFDMEIRNLALPTYLPYVPATLNFTLLSASLDAKVRLSYRQEEKGRPFLAITGHLAINNIALDDLKKKPVLRLASLDTEISSVKPLSGEIHLSKLVLNAPEVTIRRNEKGKINLSALLSGAPKDHKEKKGKTEEKTKAVVEIDEALIERGELHFHDARPSVPFDLTLSNIRLKVDRISTAAGSEGTASLSLSLPKEGVVSLEGPVRIEPLRAKLKLAVKDLDIPVFQPYLNDAVKVRITGGKFSADGNLSVDSSGGDLKTRYSGKIFVSRFASIDETQANDLLKWETLYLNGIDAGISPLFVHIREIALSDFKTRVLIDTDGTLNFQNLTVDRKEGPVTGEPTAAEGEEKVVSPSKETKAGRDIRMDAVTLQGGEIDFTDRYIKPTFSGKFMEIGGRISGLSSLESSRADVVLRGKLDGYAPLEITGKINPLKKDLFVDLKADFKNMDLSPISPYSGKYIGYSIQKGKLSLDLKYLINRKKLDSQHRIFIDQLTLGDRVESAEATKLPVSLAISLLKDRNGQIKLDIPVSGTLDDPKFSIWRIILQALVNLLTKAATAPFALLGSLFGGGEEFSFVEFDDGTAVLTEANLKKIQSLTKVLVERPALKLDIGGYVDRERDRDSLKEALFRRELGVQKLGEEIRKGKAAVPIEEVVIETAEYEKYLKMAYEAEKFPKPRDVAGLAKSLTVPEMEKLMLTHIEVKDDDLRLLASRRSLTVRDAILKSREIAPDRIFILETGFLSPPETGKSRKSRVDFRLK
jgi:hypothetical protein